MKDIHDLFSRELKELYSVELQLVKALPELAKAAHHEPLKKAFTQHLEETKNQVKRLEEIGKELNIDIKGRECEVMKQLIKEGQEVIRADYNPEVKDAAIIHCAQKVEHFEIASYGTMKALANHLGLKSVEKLLHETSKEEGHADKLLSEIALGSFFKTGVNEKAVKKSS